MNNQTILVMYDKMKSIYSCMWVISMSNFAIVSILFEVLATDKHLHLSILLLKCIGMHIVIILRILYPWNYFSHSIY